RSVPGEPISDPRFAPDAKKRLAYVASLRPIAATSPQTWARGKTSCAMSERNQAPLPSPLSAERRVSMVDGEAIGPPPSEVSLIRPKNPAALTSPFLIGRNSQ